jgi:hypothetical protein
MVRDRAAVVHAQPLQDRPIGRPAMNPLAAGNKKPRGVSGGANLSFFDKRGNCKIGGRIQIFYCFGSGSCCFYNYCSSGV